MQELLHESVEAGCAESVRILSLRNANLCFFQGHLSLQEHRVFKLLGVALLSWRLVAYHDHREETEFLSLNSCFSWISSLVSVLEAADVDSEIEGHRPFHEVHPLGNQVSNGLLIEHLVKLSCHPFDCFELFLTTQGSSAFLRCFKHFVQELKNYVLEVFHNPVFGTHSDAE